MRVSVKIILNGHTIKLAFKQKSNHNFLPWCTTQTAPEIVYLNISDE